jgi:hypothetical protein
MGVRRGLTYRRKKNRGAYQKASVTAFETSRLTLGEAVATRAGSKNAVLLGDTSWSPGPLKVQWEPKSFDGSESSRVSICLQSTDAAEADLAGLESWAVATVASDPRRYLGQSISTQQVKDRFVSCVKANDRGFKTIRCKVNLTGKNAVRCWDEKKAQRPMPEEWLGLFLSPHIVARSIWAQSSQWGIVLELTDAQVLEPKLECPF